MTARDDYPNLAAWLRGESQTGLAGDAMELDTATAFREIDVLRAEVASLRQLADDLADVLCRMVIGWEPIIGHDLAQHPDVQRVMERFRSGRVAAGVAEPGETP